VHYRISRIRAEQITLSQSQTYSSAQADTSSAAARRACARIARHGRISLRQLRGD
jgi:hypothetical protein